MYRRIRDPYKWDKARPSIVGGGNVEGHGGAAVAIGRKNSHLPTWDDVSWLLKFWRQENATKYAAIRHLSTR